MATGSIEVHVDDFRVLSEAEPLPILVADVDLDGSLKLGSGAGFPSVTTVFHYEQNFAEATISKSSGFSATFGGSPRIDVFRRVTANQMTDGRA